MQDFLVIDTEGKEEITEIAVIDAKGNIIYEAYNSEHPSKKNLQMKRKSLSAILTDFQELAQRKCLVFHYAEHDLKVIRQSFKKIGEPYPNFEYECTWELAQQCFPDLNSYSLEYLSKQLMLRVEGNLFYSEAAHAARYDAAFTYQLYQRIQETINPLFPLRNEPNPFSESRVDHPFQQYPDYSQLYQEQFTTLQAVVREIKVDPNHQSKGAVVIGEAGSGKTHLMMRLAQTVLKTNRLLFIRQPNHPDAVLFHIYSRVLESLVESIPNTQYTQLDYLLAQGFIKFLESNVSRLSAKGKELLQTVSESELTLFEILNQGSTSKKQQNWKRLERYLIDWWTTTYAGAGSALAIIKGIIKYCRYRDFYYKQLITRWLAGGELSESESEQIGLENWSEQLSREAFALEALSVFGKFSLLDEPLIIVFDQLEGLGLPYNHRTLLSFGEAVKEIFTHVPNSLIILNLFPDRWEQFQQVFDDSVVDRVSQYQLHLSDPNLDALKKILNLKLASIGKSLTDLFTVEELEDILGQSSIRSVINRASAYYNHKIHGTSLPAVYDSFSPTRQDNDYRLQKLEEEVTRLKRQFQQFFQSPDSIPSQESPSTEVERDSSVNAGEQTILDYLEQQRQQLKRAYQKPTIINEHDDLGKLVQIVEAFQMLRAIEMHTLRLGKRKIPEHLVVKTEQQGSVLGFLHINGSSFTSRLKNFNQLVSSHRNLDFILMRDAREANITGKVGRQEISKLQAVENGQFVILEEEDRVELELIYKLVTDIQNRDLDVKLENALETVLQHNGGHWLWQRLLRTS